MTGDSGAGASARPTLSETPGARFGRAVPGDATPETEVRVTTQSRQDYLVLERPRSRDFSAPLRLETAVRIDESTLEADSDVRALALDRVVSITPMTWSLTARDRWIPRL